MNYIFNCMPKHDGVSWNSLISGYASCGLSSSQGCVDLGRQIHGQIVKFGFGSYVFVGCPLMVMYSKAGAFEEWYGGGFQMTIEGLAMDQFTFGSMLAACGGLMALEEGKQVHAFVIRTNHKENIFVGSALVDMYCKCKSITSAEAVFKRMTHKNVVSWNGYSEEAIRIFCDMQRNGISPDYYTLGSVISSCVNLASLEEGVQFHGQAIVSGLLSFTTVSNALVTLYGKCGNLEDANLLFNEMNFRDEVAWTALVSGYSQFGKANETIDLFQRMLAHGLKPDAVTFVGVLSACSRAGLVEKGYQYFASMVKKHGIMPVVDHYTCMIDLLSRAGRLEEARCFINKMPFPPDAIGWSTLLSSCRLHGNLEIGKWAAASLQEVEPHNPAGYILLSSIYAAKGKWDNVAELRRGMRNKGVRKEPGCSWIKYKGKVHIFSADDQTSPFSDQIYAELDKLNHKMIDKGYVPDMSSVLHDVEESE
ncbi:hypothetical protein CRYUN_Cryun29cG0087300 [Craigia yunnanensis]